MNRDNGHGNGVAILYHLQRDVARIDRDVERIDREAIETRLDLARLGTRLSIYAALGAVVGGGAVSLLVKFLAP